MVCLGDICLLLGKTSLKYLTWLMLVSSDYYILIFSARFGDERPSWVLVPFVWTCPVWLLWHSHAHTVCTPSGIDKYVVFMLWNVQEMLHVGVILWCMAEISSIWISCCKVFIAVLTVNSACTLISVVVTSISVIITFFYGPAISFQH